MSTPPLGHHRVGRMSNANTGPGPNPHIYQASDYQGNVIQITIPFNATTLALQNATVFRDAACLYTKIFIGIGPDGTPNTAVDTFVVPAGTTTVTTQQMSAKGLHTITDVEALQITAGP